MSSYRRAKREDAIKPSKKEMSISLGSSRDSFEELQTMCNNKANELTKSVELNIGEEMNVVFWTTDLFAELIGVAKIEKNSSGMITYSLDFSESTL
ncbi:MAG: hypothetical protein HDS55_03255 [Barnesiella sp.]|nr:hypothetical protein [Barnesiella sp.]